MVITIIVRRDHKPTYVWETWYGFSHVDLPTDSEWPGLLPEMRAGLLYRIDFNLILDLLILKTMGMYP